MDKEKAHNGETAGSSRRQQKNISECMTRSATEQTFDSRREEEQHSGVSVGKLRPQFNQHWIIKSCGNVAWPDEPPNLQLHIYFYPTLPFQSPQSQNVSDMPCKKKKKKRTQQFEFLFFLLGTFQQFSPSIIKSRGPVVDPCRYAIPWRGFEFNKRERGKKKKVMRPAIQTFRRPASQARLTSESTDT